jgi:hypothetical protein
MHTKIRHIDLMEKSAARAGRPDYGRANACAETAFADPGNHRNLSNTERVFVGLDLRPRGTDPFVVGKVQKHGG